MPKERIEVRDGKEYRVTTLPPDKRSTPSKTRERTIFQSLTPGQQSAVIRKSIKASRRRRRRRKQKGEGDEQR